jgi:hypothetical protein
MRLLCNVSSNNQRTIGNFLNSLILFLLHLILHIERPPHLGNECPAFGTQHTGGALFISNPKLIHYRNGFFPDGTASVQRI